MSSPTIGIGVTTYNRPEVFQIWFSEIIKYRPENALTWYSFDDDLARKGVAKSKNECLRHLQHCDYIFLFDDDCFPIAPDWHLPFIKAHKESKQHHFQYITQRMHWKATKTAGNVSVFNEAMGCLMFMTKEAVQRVGGFNEAFGLYGFEHAEYSQRIYNARLNTLGPYLTLNNIQDYIHSIDSQGILPEHADWVPADMKLHGKIKSSIHNEDLAELLKVNAQLFKTIPSTYQKL